MEHTIRKKYFKNRTVFFYMVCFFISSFFILDFINQSNKVCLEGIVKNKFETKYIYSDYNGFIQDVFINKNSVINKDKLYTILVEDPEKIERENQIIFLEEYIKNSKDKNKIEDAKKEIKRLKNITNKKTIYSDLNFNKRIDAIYFSNNESVRKNQKLIKLKDNKNSFYIETYVLSEDINTIKNGLKINIFFENQKKQYNGIVEKIYFDLYEPSDIFKSSGLNYDSSAYKVKIKFLQEPLFLKKGLKTNIKVIFKRKSYLEKIKEFF